MKVIRITRNTYAKKDRDGNPTGEQYEGCNVLCSCPSDSPDLIGTFRFFVRAEKLPSGCDVGSDVRVMVNSRGFIDYVELIRA